MPQPKEARITCTLCNGWYNSESELRSHMESAHRRFVSEESTLRLGTKEEWTKLTVQLRDQLRLRFNPEELDVIDRFIRLGGQGSIFDHVHG